MIRCSINASFNAFQISPVVQQSLIPLKILLTHRNWELTLMQISECKLTRIYPNMITLFFEIQIIIPPCDTQLDIAYLALAFGLNCYVIILFFTCQFTWRLHLSKWWTEKLVFQPNLVDQSICRREMRSLSTKSIDSPRKSFQTYRKESCVNLISSWKVINKSINILSA